MTRKRRFFSGPSLEAALVAAGNEYGLAPEKVQYRPIEKKHGFLKIRRNVVIEVDPENPERPVEEKAKKKADGRGAGGPKAEAVAATVEESQTSSADEEGRLDEEPSDEDAPEDEVSYPAGDSDAEGDAEEDGAEEEDGRDEDDGDSDGDEGDDQEEEDDDTPEPPDLEFADEEDERAYRAVMRGEELPPLRSRKRGGGQGRSRKDQGPKDRSRKDRGRQERASQGRSKGRGGERGGRDDHRQEKSSRSGGRKGRGQAGGERDQRSPQAREGSGRKAEEQASPRRKRARAETETRSMPRREPEDLQPVEKRLKKGKGEKAEAALEATEWLLDLVDLDVDCEVYDGDERFEVELRGRDRKFLVADSGKVLSALEHLIPRVMRGICGEGYPIRTDSENFQEMREERLKNEALETAARVRRDGDPAILDAMDPADRRIVHITLTDDPEVTTRSLGDGYFKRVKILPK